MSKTDRLSYFSLARSIYTVIKIAGELQTMGYEKKIAVLKQIGTGYAGGDRPVAGIFKIENYAGSCRAEVSLLGAKEGAFHAAVLCADGQSYRFTVQNAVKTQAVLPDSPSFTGGVACLILSDGDYNPVAFGMSGLMNCSVQAMRDEFIKSMGAGKKDRLTIEEPRKEAQEIPPQEETEQQDTAEEKTLREEEELYSIYQDEVVASENYFLMPDVDMGTLSIVETKKENARDEGGDRQDGDTSESGDSKESGAGKSTQVIRDEACAFPIENSNGRSGSSYYQTVKAELDTLFADYPEEHVLAQNVPDSRWVRVDAGGGKHYVVGVIEQGGQPAYICYGVPGRYQKNPPKALDGYCSYLPLSVFDLHGDGYWMMFQDADTGDCCHVNLA